MNEGIRQPAAASLAGEYVTRRIAGETIVVPIRSQAALLDAVYVLNEVGARAWELIQQGRGEDEVVATLAGEFEVEPERARADLLGFLGVLREAGLVVSEPAA